MTITSYGVVYQITTDDQLLALAACKNLAEVQAFLKSVPQVPAHATAA